MFIETLVTTNHNKYIVLLQTKCKEMNHQNRIKNVNDIYKTEVIKMCRISKIVLK